MGNSGTVRYRSRALSLTERLKIVATLLGCNCVQERERRETILGLLNTEFQGILLILSPHPNLLTHKIPTFLTVAL